MSKSKMWLGCGLAVGLVLMGMCRSDAGGERQYVIKRASVLEELDEAALDDLGEDWDESYSMNTAGPTPSPVVGNGNGPATTGDKRKQICKSYEESIEGEIAQVFKWNVWKPEHCDIPHEFNYRTCFAGKRIAMYGDSLLRDVVKKMTRLLRTRQNIEYTVCEKPDKLPKHWCDERSRRFTLAKHGLLDFFWMPSAAFAGAFNDPMSLDSIKKADYIYFSSGMWDMGAHHRSPIHFYTEMDNRIKFIKENAKPTAKITIITLHWLHTTTNCPPAARCNLCNSPEKASVYRSMLRILAACHSLPLFDPSPVTKQAAGYTHDGVHFNRFFQVESDYLLHHICDDEFKFEVPSTPCDLEEAKKRWDAVPEAKVACRTG
eukprot:TRINITY_DN9680_c0_g1_i1.p1 TRINITY_DN9680_c0_g1~~TRINITY_DN9680_c0_g1_i1.p1  ORF type:complete len:390 (+),score=55.22 TRINITY_DN9680_c0_g1_i1:48-1172(+)